jgi:two-component system, NarL family, response regulator NreC
MNILIVDDHRIVRDGLQAVLEGAGFAVVGTAANGREAIARARDLRPEVILMDISMPELNGIEATRALMSEVPGTRVLGLSARADRYSVLAMFAAGAHGYLCKNAASRDELVQAIHTVMSGHKYVSPSVASLVLEHSVDATGNAPHKRRDEGRRPISMRERDVLRLLAEGKSSKEIASALSLALPTVETHRRQLMSKLGLRSIAELTKYAVREGLSPLEAD